jgi:hypothetical protein
MNLPRSILRLGGGLAAAAALAAALPATESAALPVPTPDPFGNGSAAAVPPGYAGPTFRLSHDYPGVIVSSPRVFPWREAIGGGRITPQNAAAYTAALKAYVLPDMQALVENFPAWTGGTLGWFHEPWLDALREPLKGLYIGGHGLAADNFPGTGLSDPFDTYVLTLYERQAATTLRAVWGTDALQPTLDNPAVTQFQDGAVVVKLAFFAGNAASPWPVLAGALTWDAAYIASDAYPARGGQLASLPLFQMDVIVKDSVSSPQTGWVFTTFVYDQGRPGGFWDRMVPLGAQWGNDPGVTDPARLQENWINSAAPAYSRMTLGPAGRLSGPNDGALNDAVFVSAAAGGLVTRQNLPSSSCMGCHSSAQWPMKSFLLPAVAGMPLADPPVLRYGLAGGLLLWEPDSPQWWKWFQSRPGNVPMDAGAVAFDYDMVFAFKSLPQWQAWHQKLRPVDPREVTHAGHRPSHEGLRVKRTR